MNESMITALVITLSLVMALIIVSAVAGAVNCYYRERCMKLKHEHIMEEQKIKLELERVKLRTEKEKTKREALKHE